jgi:hypothetical protein
MNLKEKYKTEFKKALDTFTANSKNTFQQKTVIGL